MATQTYEWIIRARQEGFASAAQEVERETNRIRSALSDLESRTANPRESIFANTPANSRRAIDLNDLRAQAREYDNVAAAAAKLRAAELARQDALRRINAPFAKDYIKDPGQAARLDASTLAAVNAASRAHVKAIEDEIAALQAAEAAARRRATFGATASTMFNATGGVAYPGKDDLFNNSIQTAVANARRQTVEQEKAAAAQARADAREEASLRRSWINLQKQNLAEGIREAGERRRQAAADVEGQRQQAIYDQFTPSFQDADASTRLGQAQTRVSAAERALEAATVAKTQLLERGNASAIAMLRADASVYAATQRLSAARTRLAAEESRASINSRGFFGRTQGQFMEGFRGASDRPYAEQIGQAFKFSVFYGTAYKLLFALTTTLTATLQEGIEFQNAMTELKIASGASADAAREMAAGLGEQATAAGQAPSTGVLIGARSLGLFGATESSGASLADQERIATISARVVSRMALGSKTSPEELQTQIAAVANAFGGGAAGQIRAYDLDAYLGRQFGIQQGMTVQAVAESGTVGQAAGFDQEQVSAIAAYLQSRTGQTPSAVAGWMAQIFSRGGEGSLVALTQRYGIDPNAELSTQIQELSRVYASASETERAEIAAGFGRGKVQNAAVVLLEGLDEVMRTADRSRTESRGEGDRISDLRLGNIGGQIQLTVAAMQAFASELSQSGVLEILGAALLAFRELVEAGTGLLRLWNELSGGMKTAIVAIGAFAVALRAGAAGAVARGAAGLLGGGGIGAAGAGARGMLASAGPWVAALGGLYALGELKNSTDALRRAEEDASQILNDRFEGTSPDDYRARAAELQQGATITREAVDSSWMNDVLPSSRARSQGLAEDASAMEIEAARLERSAKILENAAAETAAGMEVPVITGFDEESLTQSMDAITRSGGSAETRLRALNDALNGTAEAAGRIPENKVDVFAAANANPLINVLSDNITGITGEGMSQQSVIDALSGWGSSPEAALQLALRGAGVNNVAKLDEDSAKRAAMDLVAQTEGSADYIGTEEYNTAVEAVQEFLLTQTANARDLVDTARQLTPTEAMATINQIAADTAERAGNLQETDFRGAIANQRRAVRMIRSTIRQTAGGATTGMTRELNNARWMLAESQFNELEAMRRAAQQNAKSRAEVARIGQRFLRREINAAIRAGNTDLLAEILGQAGEGAVKVAQAVIREALAAARAARAAFRAMATAREMVASAVAMINPLAAGLGQLPQENPDAGRVKELQGMLSSIPNMVSAAPDDDVYTLGSDVPGYEPPPSAKDKPKKSAEDKKAEREQARQEMLDLKNNLYLLSIDLSDPLAMAVAAVKDARRRLQSDIASGQDRGVIAASRVALRQAEIEREATAFQQRLDSVTTAEELGRISHRKYVNYLENEKRRLEGIKNRTFQQQEQLDQIDRLMKDAADSMQGMWNFGDIKLPTPYQVRRQVEQMRVDRATQLDATSRQVANNSTIYIDGADVGKVRQIINETLGKSNATVTNRPRKR